MAPTVADARRLAELGLRPLWLVPPWSGGPRAGKHPVDDEWESVSYLRPEEFPEPPGQGCNLGIRLGRVAGSPWALAAIGIDGDEVSDLVSREVGPSPMAVRTARGVQALYKIRSGEVIPHGARLKTSQIEVLGERSQIVVAPSVHRFGHVYSEVILWTPLLVASIPEIGAAHLAADSLAMSQSAVSEILRDIPPTRPAMLWLGNAAELISPAVADRIRESLDGDSRTAFDLGCDAAACDAKLTRPSDVARDVLVRIRQACASDELHQSQGAPWTLQRLVRHVRRYGDRATFDVVIMQGNASATITGLSGDELISWRVIHGRAVEARMVLPCDKDTKAKWPDLVASAMNGCEDIVDDSEADAATALTDQIRLLVGAMKEGETKDDLARGYSIRVRNECCVSPPWLVRQLRVSLSADRLDRGDIVAAVRRCGGNEKQVTLKDGHRPRVWAFSDSGDMQ